MLYRHNSYYAYIAYLTFRMENGCGVSVAKSGISSEPFHASCDISCLSNGEHFRLDVFVDDKTIFKHFHAPLGGLSRKT